jgi:hypothetical protein
MKTPDKWKSKDRQGFHIVNGCDVWHYSALGNTYYHEHTEKNRNRFICPVVEFSSQWQIEILYRKSYDWCTVEKGPGSYQGRECTAIKITVPGVSEPGLPVVKSGGELQALIYEDQRTGLMVAKTVSCRDADGKLRSVEHIEYEYNTKEMPDDFFVFHPPAGAMEVPVPK